MDTTTEVGCRFCAAMLHRAPRPGLDEWGWAGRDGRAFGTDADLAALIPDPYAYLSGLGALLMHAADKRKRKPPAPRFPSGLWKPPPGAGWLPCEDLATEYVMLKTRIGLAAGTTHEHYPAGPIPYDGPPAPVHCGWPALLRPSGWACRQCDTRLGAPA